MAKTQDSYVHELNSEEAKSGGWLWTFITLAIILLSGIVVGYIAATSGRIASSVSPSIIKGVITKKQSEGVLDKKRFPDNTEGILREGGIDGEGNFHLERPGGKSQNVYLTSSIVDLSKYIGKKVKVRGETFTGEKAGWLMDVGYIEIK